MIWKAWDWYKTREGFVWQPSQSPSLMSSNLFIKFQNWQNSFTQLCDTFKADLSYDVITYDSDDEMVKTRRGIPFGSLRNKKGHPIYSREDIREQYCINRKELDVLEHSFKDSTAARLFGCLSTSHLPDSHCSKNSFLLLSCVQRRKNSSDFDEESDSGIKYLLISLINSYRNQKLLIACCLCLFLEWPTLCTRFLENSY